MKEATHEAQMIKWVGESPAKGKRISGRVREQKGIVWKRLKDFLKTPGADEKERLREARRGLKKIRKEEIEEQWKERWERVCQSRNTTDLWTALRPFRPRKLKNNSGQIGEEEWFQHFMQLLGGRDETKDTEACREKVDGDNRAVEDTKYTNDTNEGRERDITEEIANREINKEEVEKELRKMKKGKAAGQDGLVIEFFQGLPKEGREELVDILNNLWKEGKLARGWEIGRIYPIFKAGDASKVKNYRGITLMDAGYKLLTRILNNRIRYILKARHRLGEGQAGFRAGRGTRDHIFVLNTLINNRLKRRGGKLYTAFIDFRTAFDSVDREGMTRKLEGAGIQGRALEMIKKIYENTQNEIITAEGVTRKFETTRGVRQGCALSPTLFNVFIEDMETGWKRRREGGSVIGGEKIYALKYADDVALVADTGEGIRSMLKDLEKFVERNKLEVNMEKTKLVIFKKGGRQKKERGWHLNGKKIEVVNEYKYLGVHFSTGNTFEKHIRMVESKIKKAANAAWGIAKRARIGRLTDRLRIADAIARSGLLYGVEVWGWKRRERVERAQARYTKMAMGLRRNTPEYIWKMEAGCKGIDIVMVKRAADYIGKILGMEEGRWPKKCLMEEARGLMNGDGSKWGKEMKAAMSQAGEGQIGETIRRGNLEEWERKAGRAVQKLADQEVQKMWAKVNKSKFCKEYRERKKEVGMEEYWYKGTTRGEIRETWAKMRCGSVGREAEKGFRDTGCRVCGKSEETLAHILECSEARRQIEAETLRNFEEWEKREMEKPDGGWRKALERKDIVEEICEIVRQFEKIAKRKELEK